jgi:hypothetical protein
MKKVKQFFSPRSLAATVATGMLVFGTLNVWADALVSACSRDDHTCTPLTACGSGQIVCSQSYGGYTYLWCCGSASGCGTYVPFGTDNCANYWGCGWCIGGG